MPKLRLPVLAALVCVGSVSCQSTTSPHVISATSAMKRGPQLSGVKTTAYTHTEEDHKKYKVATAAGGTLKYGAVRSAAADWAVYPVGTVFKIEGDAHTYEIDDYGSALVGTETIDLYKPSKSSMRSYGARQVNIKVVKWGSIPKSLAILKPREGKSPHISKMIRELERGES